jgi:hypothetical protein
VQARLQQFVPLEIADSLLRWDDRRRASRVDQLVTTVRPLLSGDEIRDIVAPQLRFGGLLSLLRLSGDRITPPANVLPTKADARIPGFAERAIEPCYLSVQPRGSGFTILASMETPGCWVYHDKLLMSVGSTVTLPSAVPQGVHLFGWDFTAGTKLEIREDGLSVVGKAVLQILQDTP